MIAVVSPEMQRGGVTIKSAYNAAALQVHGIEPQYQAIRTIDIERGRMFRFTDEDEARCASRSSAPTPRRSCSARATASASAST